jgi:hypothetical protein
MEAQIAREAFISPLPSSLRVLPHRYLCWEQVIGSGGEVNALKSKFVGEALCCTVRMQQAAAWPNLDKMRPLFR